MAKPSRPSRWLPGLRALLTIGRELGAIRRAVERLADATAGRLPPPVDLPAAEVEPLAIEYTRDSDYGRQFAIELRLTRQLGRAPTPDEIVRELDGEEEAAQDAPTVVVGRRQPEREIA